MTERRASGFLIFLLLAGLVAFAPAAAAEPAGERPDIRLVLVIIVDQLRGDALDGDLSRLSGGGFNRFYQEGLVYRRALMRFAPTSTGPGHATLATGALPSVHGIAGNEWWDRSSGKKVYCTADPQHGLVGSPVPSPAGFSPRNLRAETLGDALFRRSSGASRTLAVSLKDRSAILMAGHRGKAVWYLRQEGRFVSSDYYYPQLPAWLEDFNTKRMKALDTASWTLLLPEARYRFADRDDQPWERNYHDLGRTFPHRLEDTPDPGSALRLMPLADELTVELAIRGATAEGLGRGPATDLLVVALSATDYIGHSFGPDSLEWEDNLMRLDSQVARLLEWADREIGPDHALVALSADHGIASAPEFLDLQGEAAGRIDVPGMLEGLRHELTDEFGLKADPLLGAKMPAIYLDWRVMDHAGVDRETAERAAGRYVERVEGVAAALTRTDLLSGRVPAGEPMQRILAGFDKDRSGDLVIVQQPGWYLENDPEKYATNHGSPYDYDAHVPMMFLAPGLPSAVSDRVVGTDDLAPSIAGFLGFDGPAQASGVLLKEIASAAGAGSYNPPQ